MIIDMHTHPYEESVKYLPIRNREEAKKYTTGRPSDLWEGWVEKMIQLGIDRAVVFGALVDNDFVAEMVRKYAPYLIGFAYLYPTEGDLAIEELERCVKELGLKGVKLITFYQAIPFDSPFVRKILEKAQGLQIPVVFDCWGANNHEPIMNDPRVKAVGNPEVYRDLKIDLHDPLRLLLGDFLDGLEDLTIVAAHMGGYAPLYYEIPEKRLKQFYFDTAWWYDDSFFAKSAEAHRSKIEQMIEKVGADRILFGSDDLQDGALRFMDSLRIPDEMRAQIMGENAMRLLNL
jgi:aminocarboxymuconate-semialdehyde decarboxylase